MKRIIYLLFWLLALFSPIQAQEQDSVLDTLIARFERSMPVTANENIYLQTSKDIYETGEDLWFKGYVLDAQSLQLSPRSRTLYVQMFAAQGGDLQKPVWQEKYLIKDGTVSGHIFVDNNLSEGNYFIEAYTCGSLAADSSPITSLRKVQIVKDISKTKVETQCARDSSAVAMAPADRTTCSLHLVGQDEHFLEFSVANNSQLSGKQAIYLFAQLRGMVCCIARAMLQDSITIKIPLSEFPSQGMAEFTLYDSALQAIDKYQAYVHPKKQLNITATLDRQSYETRGKAILTIKVTDPRGTAVANANLGVSIFDRIYAQKTDTINIVNYGYRSQNYKHYGAQVIQDQITGQLLFKNKSFQNTQQLIQLSDAQDHTQLILVDTSGLFSLNANLLESLSAGYLYLKVMADKESRPRITFDDQFALINQARQSKSRSYPFLSNITPQRRENMFGIPYNTARDSAIIMENITIKSKFARPVRDKFMGKLNEWTQKYLGPWVCEHGHLENYIEGYTVHHDPRYCPCPNEPKEKNSPVVGKTYRIIKPKYFANPAVRGGWTFIVEDVRTILYQAPYYTDEQLLEMNNMWRTKTFYDVRDFYQPSQEEMKSAIPDFRNTLLWMPDVITDENGEATLEFYCSDINTLFTVRAEGVAGEGMLGHSTLDFRVKRLPPPTHTTDSSL